MSVSGVNNSSGNAYVPSTKSAEDEDEEKKTENAETENAEKSGSTDSSGTTGAAEETKDPTEAEKLALYKKNFVAKLQSLMSKPHLANITLQLNITDTAYSKMMSDSSYETLVMEQFEKRTGHTYVAQSGTLSLIADGKAENTTATFEEDYGMARRLFGNSPRSIIRGASIDSLSALALETIEYRQTNSGKFDLAALTGASQMRPTTTYLTTYLKNAGLLDTTG